MRAVPDVGDARVVEATAEPVAEPAPLAVVEDDGAAPSAPRRRARPAAASAAPAAKKSAQHRTVRVDAARLDQLMHLMGELVVQRTHVEALSAEADVPGLGQAMQELTRSSHALQAMVMQIRMIPVDAVFTALPAAGPRRRRRAWASRSSSTSSARRPSWTARSSTRSATRSCT